MVGPSSSHTAGVARIGVVARRILGQTPNFVTIRFHGSLAKTHKGHGSDKAIIAGLMGFAPDDLRIPDSFALAKEAGMFFEFFSIELEEAHPNTVVLELGVTKNKIKTIIAASTGGGNILVSKIDDVELRFTGLYDTLLVNHKDELGVIAHVSYILADEKINIAELSSHRSIKGGTAIMVIEVDAMLTKSARTRIRNMENVFSATYIRGALSD